MINLILIIIVIILFAELRNYKLDKEELNKKIKQLEQELKQYKSGEEVQNQSVNNEAKVIKQMNVQKTINNNPQITSSENYKKYESKTKNEEVLKNKFILSTGAVLIVLSAIVFLTSTWTTVPNIIKTGVILLLVGVFIMASKIAKNVFKLEETSNTFLYIGLAYLPIALFSISFFGLLGKELSVGGEQQNVYFTLISIALAIIYYIVGKSKKQKILINSSIIMQIIGVMFSSQILEPSFKMLVLFMTIYSLIISTIKQFIEKEYKGIFEIYSTIILGITSYIQLALLLNNSYGITVFTNLIITINYFLKYKEYKRAIYSIACSMGILAISISALNLIELELVIATKEIIFEFIIIAMYFTGIISKEKNWKESIILITTISMPLLFIYNIFFDANSIIIKNYLFLWIFNVLNIINYHFLPARRKIIVPFIPIGLFIAQLATIAYTNISINYLVILSLSIFTISILNILKEKECNQLFLHTSNVILILSILISAINRFDNFIEGTLFLGLITLIYFIGYLENPKIKVLKIVSYLFSNLVLYSIMYKLNFLEYLRYIPVITTLIITALDLCLEKLNDEVNEGYIICSFIISFLVLNFELSILSYILLIVLSFVFYGYCYNGRFSEIKNIAFLALIPLTYFYNTKMIMFRIIVNFAIIIITTLLSLRKEKANIYTFISGGFILLQIMCFDISTYANLAVLMVWAYLHLVSLVEKEKFFEFVLYFVGLIFYNNIIKDLPFLQNTLYSLTAGKLLGYLVVMLLISRRILKEIMKNNYKIFEYIGCAIIYFIAIFNYTNEYDGMLFVLIIAIVTIISYLNKMGPAFITSIIAIVLNAFILTRNFWFSVPWWVYLLTIGSVLIIFATRNELKEKNQKGIMKEKIKNFKEYMDI